MTGKSQAPRDLKVIPMLLHETLYVGVDVGKKKDPCGRLPLYYAAEPTSALRELPGPVL